MAATESSKSIMIKHLLGLALNISLKLLKQKLRSQVDFYGSARVFSCELSNWQYNIQVIMNVTVEVVLLDLLKQDPL